MAEPEVTDEKAKGDAPAPSEKTSLWKRFCSRKWLGTVIALTIVAHVSLIALQAVRGAKRPTLHTEVTLGSFEFTNRSGGGLLSDAHFDLHVRLLLEVENDAHIRLDQRRFKVAQDIQELLRQASGGDFDDPALTELKRQIQERINQSLEIRAISEVIITDLALTRRVKEVADAEPTEPEQDETVEKTEWREKAPS